MKNKRMFFGGLILGLALAIVINTAYAGASSVYRGSAGAAMTSDTKIKQILSLLETYYVDDFDKAKLEDSMYTGLVNGIGDPYTTYMDKKALANMLEQTDGSYTGVGVVVSIDSTDNRITVISPFDGSPGAKAGILPGDKIIKVNGFDVSIDNYEEAVSMMKGKAGTTVDVTIYRDSDKSTKELTITREQIDIPTVTHKMLEDNIGYLRISNFDRVTVNQFEEAYNDLQKSNMSGLIIDLRNNPGGLLDSVTAITDKIVPKGFILYTEDKQDKKEYTYSDDNSVNVPLVVIVNGNSASASEVMSGAIKDMGVGELVGTQTFGKGLVQSLFTLPDESGLKVTIAKYYTPSGVCINGEGITPDYVVDMDNELSVQISSLTLDEDVQLKKAVEVIKDKID